MNTKQTEALKLADELDAEFAQGRISNHTGRKAAQFIREALSDHIGDANKMVEQPAQQEEPIAWIERDMNCDEFDPDSITYQKPDTSVDGWEWVPLYTSPPNVLTARASKPWVGLTQEDMYEIGEFKNTHGYVPTGFKRLVAAIEAKLREKNA